jgi:endonuclease III
MLKCRGMKPFTPAQATRFFELLAAERPNPTTELVYKNPYTLLVAVALSAQATDVSVNKATGPLFQAIDTPQKMLALGEAKLRAAIKTIGLYRTKASNVMRAAAMLVEKHGGQVPEDRAALEELPGVGRKTANVVLNVAFGHATIAVDTHIFRLSNRTGIAPGKDPRAVEAGLERIVPAQFKHHAHHWMILHGRYVCTAHKPKCESCVVNKLCQYEFKTSLVDERLSRPVRPASNKARASSASPPTKRPSPRRARKSPGSSRGG